MEKIKKRSHQGRLSDKKKKAIKGGQIEALINDFIVLFIDGLGKLREGDMKGVYKEGLQKVIIGDEKGIMGGVIDKLKILIGDLKGVLKATSSKYLNRPKNHS